MRNYLKMVVFLVIMITPASLIAQVPINRIIQKPSKFYSGNDFSTRLNLKSIVIEPSKPDTKFSFNFQFPNENKTIVVEPVEMSPRYRHNMPVFKPGNNSKILIAKLDPEFPYRYNMPVLKEADAQN